MSISERARSRPTEMPEQERSITELFRIAAREWVEAEKAAHMLEETKSATLSQMMLKHGEIAVSRSEMYVKASGEWRDFIKQMVDARAEANFCKVKLEWLRMREREIDRTNWNERSERKMARSTT